MVVLEHLPRLVYTPRGQRCCRMLGRAKSQAQHELARLRAEGGLSAGTRVVVDTFPEDWQTTHLGIRQAGFLGFFAEAGSRLL